MRCQILLTAWMEVLRQSPVDTHHKDVRYCSLHRHHKDEMPNPNVYGAFLTRLQRLKVCFFPSNTSYYTAASRGKQLQPTHTNIYTHTQWHTKIKHISCWHPNSQAWGFWRVLCRCSFSWRSKDSNWCWASQWSISFVSVAARHLCSWY